MKTKAALIGAAGVLVLVAAALLLLWPHPQTLPGARVLVRGGDGGGLPRALPQDEQLDAAKLERARDDAATAGLQAFVVMHHDHIVFERYGHGVDADTVIDSGPFAQALLALAVGVAVQSDNLPVPAVSGFDPPHLRDAVEAAAHQSYADFLSRRLWSRLNAGPAEVRLPAAGAQAPADCCFEARLLDWMRIAGLLLEDGRFEGTDVVPRGWVARMLRPISADGARGFGVELAPAAHGAQPFAAEGVFFLRGNGHWRLWLMPTLKLAVLFGARPEPDSAGAPSSGQASGLAAAERWDETRLPNLVIAALTQAPTQRDATQRLQQLVPGHAESR
jgi:hypothetical protein